jgi:hypothetical protein
MRFKKSIQDAPIFFADLPQHPADGLVDKIARIIQEQVCESKRIFEIAAIDERERRENGDASFPEILRAGELVQNPAIAIDEIDSDDARRAEIHEIPIIDPFRVFEVGAVDALAFFFLPFFELPHEDEERRQPLLVEFRLEELKDLPERKLGMGPRDDPLGRHHDAEEPVSFAVLPFSGLEETHEEFCLFGIPGFSDGGANVGKPRRENRRPGGGVLHGRQYTLDAFRGSRYDRARGTCILFPFITIFMSADTPAPAGQGSAHAYTQRTIENFFEEFKVTDPDMKTKLLALLTHIIYGYNQAVIKLESEQDPYRREQMIREIGEIHDKIDRTIRDAMSGKGEFAP